MRNNSHTEKPQNIQEVQIQNHNKRKENPEIFN